MSVDILRPFSSTRMKSTGENLSLSSDGASKCAEIFVTNNGSKWTFFCDYCQMATSDIGVFICHIRLEHLNVHTDFTHINPFQPSLQNNTSTKGSQEITTIIQQQPVLSDMIKVEPTTASNQEDLQNITRPEYNKSPNPIATVNSSQTLQNPSSEMNQTVFEIIPIERQRTQKQLIAEPAKEAINKKNYIQNAAVEKSEYDYQTKTCSEIDKDDEIEDVHDFDSVSCYSPNGDDDVDDTDVESNDDYEAGGSEPKVMRKSKVYSDVSDLSPFKCSYCTAVFKNKQSTAGHILRNHDKELPIKCDKCQRGFLTTNGLKVHLKFHGINKHYKCPVCKTEHLENFFITHVLTHEGDGCFPCQVCGEIYTSYYKRLKHWETHAKEKPFSCSICYRRYKKPHYLARNLKSHNQYHCNFCYTEFNSPEAQRPPYLCPKCKQLSDIKQKVDHLNSLIDNNDALDSQMVNKFVVSQEAPKNNQALRNESSVENKLKPTSNITFNDNINDATNMNFSYTSNENADSDNDDLNLECIDDTLDITPTSKPHIDTEFFLHKCKYCKRAFHSKQHLDRHIRNHHISNMNQISSEYKCPQCHREFQSRSTLCQHIKAHDKKHLFKCPVCQVRKFGEGIFIAHVMLHENDTCFPCQVCGVIFASNEERVTHWKTHIEDRPYGCEICYRRFAHKPILTRHMKAHKQLTKLKRCLS